MDPLHQDGGDCKSRLEELERDLKEKQTLLYKAGEIGKSLLQENKELSEMLKSRMEQQDSEFQRKLEVIAILHRHFLNTCEELV